MRVERVVPMDYLFLRILRYLGICEAFPIRTPLLCIKKVGDMFRPDLGLRSGPERRGYNQGRWRGRSRTAWWGRIPPRK